MDVGLRDATGKYYGAKVGKDERLRTDSVQRTQFEQAVIDGYGYNISTGLITLTSAATSAVLYIRNDSELLLLIKEIGIRLGTSTGGTGNAAINLIANAETGTIITNALAPTTLFNRNLGSSRPLDGAVYKGAQGYTIVGGQNAGSTSTANFADAIIFDAEIIAMPKGTSLTVTIAPPAGNTSQSVVIFGTAGYKQDD